MSPGMRRPAALRSVTGQLLSMAAVLVAIVLGASTVLVVTLTQWNSASATTRSVARARSDAAVTVAALLQQQNAVLGYVVTGDPAERDAVTAARRTYADGIASLSTELPTDGSSRTLFTGFVTAVQAWQSGTADPMVAAAAAGDTARARDIAASGVSVTTVGRTQLTARALWGELDREYRADTATALDLRSRLSDLTIAVLAVLLAAVLAAALIVRRSVVAPLLRLQTAVRRVALGAWDDSVHVHGPSEVVALAGDVDGMRLSLLDALSNERRAAEALDQQGPAVLALRDALAPSPWTQPGFECSGRLDPVEGLLAGDWYDVIELGEHRAAVVLGDVAGHGAASGVYALRLKGLLRQALRSDLSPGAALASVAAHVARYPDNPRVASGELFATVFVAIADREVGELVYASAGHLDAVVMRAFVADDATSPAATARSTPGRGDGSAPDGDRVHEDRVHGDRVHGDWSDGDHPQLWDHVDLPSTGPMLSALLADRIWAERRHRFSAHDLLVAATDGVIDARHADGHSEYGQRRIVDRLGARLLLGDTLDDAVDAVFSDLAGFERHARDDRTMVALRQASVRRRFGSTRLPGVRPLRPA